MDSRWERRLAGEIVYHKPNRHLALAMWLLIDRGRDCPFFKVGRHLREEIRCYQFSFSGKAARAEGAAYGKAVDGIHIKSSESWIVAEKIERLLKTFVFILVSFDHTGDLAAGAVLRKRFRKAIRFLAMIFSTQHTRYHGHFGARRPVHPRFYTNDTRPPAFGGIGGHTNYADAFFFRVVDKRRETLRVSRRENDSVDAALHEFHERLGIPLAERANGAVYILRAKLCSTASFVQDSAPKLIIEKMDFPRYADANAKASLGGR